MKKFLAVLLILAFGLPAMAMAQEGRRQVRRQARDHQYDEDDSDRRDQRRDHRNRPNRQLEEADEEDEFEVADEDADAEIIGEQDEVRFEGQWITLGSLDRLPYTAPPDDLFVTPTSDPAHAGFYTPHGRYKLKTAAQLRAEGYNLEPLKQPAWALMKVYMDGQVKWAVVALEQSVPVWMKNGRPYYEGRCNNPLPVLWFYNPQRIRPTKRFVQRYQPSSSQSRARSRSESSARADVNVTVEDRRRLDRDDYRPKKSGITKKGLLIGGLIGAGVASLIWWLVCRDNNGGPRKVDQRGGGSSGGGARAPN